MPRVRHPDVGSRARAFDPIPACEEDEKHARARRGAACARGHGERPRARCEPQDRNCRGTRLHDRVRDADREKDAIRREGMERALTYMGLEPNTPMPDIRIDKVFIGSCTNSRIEDLRAAAAIVRGRRLASNIKLAMVVPGSGLVKARAEHEGRYRI